LVILTFSQELELLSNLKLVMKTTLKEPLT